MVFSPGWASITPAAEEQAGHGREGAAGAARAEAQHLRTRRSEVRSRKACPRRWSRRASRNRKLLDSDKKTADVDLASVQVTPDEYNKYLKRAYKAAKFDKPRDLLGLDKSLPPDEMKKLMIANTKVTDADLKQLAEARANAVRKALSGKIDPARLVVVAPKLNADGIKDNGKTTRADLSPE